MLRLHPRLAPYKVGVLPLVKKEGMPEVARRIADQFFRAGVKARYDEQHAIGRRYARQDEAGTPYCCTIDFETLGEKPDLLNTVTIRHRDDGKQERIPISELAGWLLARVR